MSAAIVTSGLDNYFCTVNHISQSQYEPNGLRLVKNDFEPQQQLIQPKVDHACGVRGKLNLSHLLYTQSISELDFKKFWKHLLPRTRISFSCLLVIILL